MAHTQYAAMRSQLPAPTVSAVSGGNLSGSGTVEVALQGRNRAGWNLPTALQSVSYTAGQRISIVIPSTARGTGEDIHEYVVSIAVTSGDITSIRQVAIYQGYDTDQVSPRSLPATVFLSENAHITVGAGQTVANLAALPTGANLKHGMIRQVTDIYAPSPVPSGQNPVRILEYDSESTATANGDTVFSAATGRWLKVAAFSTYVADTTAAGGCDEPLSTVDPNTIIAPPLYAPNGNTGTAVRYWYYGTRNASGEDTPQGTRLGVRVFVDDVNQSQDFDGLLKLTPNGYVDPATGALDTADMTTGVEEDYKFGKGGALILEKDLPAGSAYELAIAPAFSSSLITAIDGSRIKVDLRAFRQLGDVNPLAAFLNNAIAAAGSNLLVVPDASGVRVLDGAAAIGTLAFPLIADQVVSGLDDDTADQHIHLTGNGLAFVGTGTIGNQDAIRAKVSTVAGRSDATAWSSYTAVASGATLTVTVTHNRAIRSDYTEPGGATSALAGRSSGVAFTPPQIAVYLQRQSDGNIYEYLINATDTATQVVNIASLASANATPASVPAAPSADFSLFEPTTATFTSASGSSDLTATNYRVAVAYVYDGGQATKIQLSPATGDTAADWLANFAVQGDMVKSTYDSNSDGKVDAADSADAVAWSGVTGTPTTVSGYGITDAVPTTRTITAGTGLTGGGDLSDNRTLALGAAAIASLALADSSLQSDDIGTAVQAYSALLAAIVSGFAGATDGQVPSKSGSTLAYATPTATVADGAITTDKLADLAVTAAKIAAATITATQLADGAITTAKLADLAVTAGKIAAATITATQLADGAVATAKLADLAVTAGKIAAATITATQLADNAVATAKIANNAVTLAKLAQMTGPALLAKLTAGAGNPEAVAIQSFMATFLGAANEAAARSAIGISAGLNVIGRGAFGYRSAVLEVDFVEGGTLSRTSAGRNFFTFDADEPDTDYAVIGNATLVEAETTSRVARSLMPRNRTFASVELYTADPAFGAEDQQLISFLIYR